MDDHLNVSSTPTRKYLTAQQKFAIVKEQLTTKTGVTEICKKHGIAASQFYRWQELFFEGAAQGLETTKRNGAGSSESSQSQKQIEDQRREIERLKEVVLEIAAENVVLKKSPGVLSTTR